MTVTIIETIDKSDLGVSSRKFQQGVQENNLDND